MTQHVVIPMYDARETVSPHSAVHLAGRPASVRSSPAAAVGWIRDTC